MTSAGTLSFRNGFASGVAGHRTMSPARMLKLSWNCSSASFRPRKCVWIPLSHEAAARRNRNLRSSCRHSAHWKANIVFCKRLRSRARTGQVIEFS
jgi:hypothetical protein